MRILIINYEYPPLGGGGGVATKQLAEELARLREGFGEAKHEVHVLTTWYLGLKRDEIDEGVHVHRVKVWGRKQLPTATIRSMITFVPAALWRGWKLCQKVKFDVLNAQFVVPSGIPAALLSKLFHLPFVLSFIGGDLYDPTKGVSPHRHPVLRAVIRWVAEQAAVCTAISEDTKWRAYELHGVDKEIVVTHLGLIPHSPVTATRPALNLPEGVALFVSVGRLIPRKRYDLLLEAWRSIPAAHLAIIGDGPLKEQLQKTITEYSLQGRVHLLGFVSEEHKRNVLQAANAYVSATEHEGFGIVYLEAMEAGLPIVTMDSGGQRDFLTEDENAILVPTGDVSQLVAGIKRLLDDPGLRERMGRINKEKVKEFYLESTSKKFEDVLRKAYESGH